MTIAIVDCRPITVVFLPIKNNRSSIIVIICVPLNFLQATLHKRTKYGTNNKLVNNWKSATPYLQSKGKINWNASFSLVSLAPRKSFITLLTLFSHQYINNKNIPFPSSSSSFFLWRRVLWDELLGIIHCQSCFRRAQAVSSTERIKFK